MFEKYPKRRPTLPENIAAIYQSYYRENRAGKTPATSLSKWAESWLHRKVAEDVCADRRHRSTLEIGAGTLNQLQWEPDVGPYDIVEPFQELYAASEHLPRIRKIYSDISELPLSGQYDRITSIAEFEHICNLPEVVGRTGILLSEHGVLRVSIPSEGTLLWTLGWKLTTGLEFRLKHGLDYGLLMRHEHVNTADEIETVLRYFFASVKHAVFGLSRRASLYRYYECRSPDVPRCRTFLHSTLKPQRLD